MDATFFGSASKCRLLNDELLKEETFSELINAESFSDVLRIMDGTPYSTHIQALSGLYSSYELLEIASNRRMMNLVLKVAESPPANGREAIKSYTSRWDIDSIKNIITSKYLGKDIKKSDIFVVDRNNYPVGMLGNVLTPEDYTLMINENDIEGISKYLVKLSYGIYLLKYLDEYRKERDVSVLLYSLDIAYYSRLFESVKYFLGNEEPARFFIRDEVDQKNLMTLIKAKTLGLDFEAIDNGLMNMGNIDIQKLREMYNSSESENIAIKCLNLYGVKGIENENGISSGEAETLMKRTLLERTLPRFSLQSNSIGSIFNTLLRFENERNNLRIIFAGKAYGMDKERIRKMMVNI